jgi:DNA-binding CsgD family transcriptional regulator
MSMAGWNVGRFTAELVERAQGARDLDGVREGLFDGLQALIPCDTIYWGHAPGAAPDGAHQYRAADAPARAALQRFMAGRARFDVPSVVRAVHADGGAAIDNEVFTAADRGRLPLYTDVVRPAGFQCFLFGLPRFRGQLSSLISFMRHDAGSRFTAREKQLVRSIAGSLGLVEAAFRASAGDVGERSRALVGRLGRREAEVAGLIARGLQNKEIAALLGTSPDTVRKQSIRIYQKLEVSGRVQLALRVRDGAR